jgi:hypothetical protein
MMTESFMMNHRLEGSTDDLLELSRRQGANGLGLQGELAGLGLMHGAVTVQAR